MQLSLPRTRRAGFTLVELLVVIGLMGLLSTLSVGGYFAASRGMADRAAMQDTISLIRLAQQTALIDQVPTAVLFSNRSLGGGDEYTAGTVVGQAVAIKMMGRISMKTADLLIDEFADWDQSYSRTRNVSSSDQGMRLYRMAELDKLKGGARQCSSVVNPYVSFVKVDDYLAHLGMRVSTFCSDHKIDASGNKKRFDKTTGVENGNDYRWGFGVAKGDGLGIGAWKVGDAYGVEIGQIQLPNGYYYGKSSDMPDDSTPEKSVTALTFAPEDLTSENQYNFPLNSSVSIGANRSGTASAVGTITSEMLKDQD